MDQINRIKVTKGTNWTHASWASMNSNLSSFISNVELLLHRDITDFDKDVVENILAELQFIRSDLRLVYERNKRENF
jgi:hypothetical protein